MSRLVAIGLVLLAGCAKREAAPAEQPVANAAATGSAAAVDPAVAMAEARAQGVLGPSNQGAFDDGPDFQAKGGGGDDKVEGGSDRKVKPSDGGGPGAQPIVGGGANLGTVKLGKVELVGKGDVARVDAAVTNALTKRLDELRACYQDTLGTKPNLAGHLTLTFTIKPDGSFDAVSASTSTLKDESLETCIIDSVKAAKLAASLGKAPVKGSLAIGFLP